MKINHVDDIRSQFPIFNSKHVSDNFVYLDNGATTQKPSCVINRISEFYRNEYATVHRGVYGLSQAATHHFDIARERVQQLINAPSKDNIVFVKGTTEAINLVACSYGEHFLQTNDEILVSEIEHHANFVPWQMLAKKMGLVLKICAVTDSGDLDLESVQAQLTHRTKLVAIPHVSNVLGSIFPVEQVIKMAHAIGAKVLIDGAQAIQHLDIDVQKLNCDFYVFSGHKLYGPTGVGVLFGKSELLSAMPPYQTGGDMIEKVERDTTTFIEGAGKFEAGTPNFVDAIGFASAIDFFQSIDPVFRHQHESDLLQYATHRLTEEPDITIVGHTKEKVSVISFIMKDIHPHDVGTILDSQGICVRVGHHCSQLTMRRFGIPATIRASFALYNTRSDVDDLMKGIQQVRKVFQ